jgi:ribosomal-protein-alanine N-acetyltransferase
MFGPVLRGERVSLEPPRVEDIEIFRTWFAELETTRYLLMRFALSQKQEEEWYERAATSQSDVHWSIRVGGRTIGSTGVHGIDWINRRGSSGMVIGDRSEWGKGHGSEVVRLRTAYAFEELGLERLETESLAVNRPMHRALQKTGYREAGRRRHYVFRGGEWHDAIIFELLRDEWVESKGKGPAGGSHPDAQEETRGKDEADKPGQARRRRPVR